MPSRPRYQGREASWLELSARRIPWLGAARNPFIEFLDAVTPTSPPVFRVLTTSAGDAGAAHFYGRFATPLLDDRKVFSVRFAILDDTNGSGTPDAGDTETYVTDPCVTVTVK